MTDDPSVTDDPSPEPAPSATERKVDYKGQPLDSEKGPGLGCFWFQMVLLGIFVILTPLSAAWEWPPIISLGMLGATLVLLLFVGQTVIFLLRLVAADRRASGRRRPLASGSRTVGELEDADAGRDPDGTDEPPGGGMRE